MTPRKYLILAGVAIFASTGDSLLSRGMKLLGGVPLHRLPDLFLVVLNPTIALGILLLLGFFACYMTALSWADLTYVLPATSVSFILLTLFAKFFLHEAVSVTRWLGVLLISIAVGFVTRGPAQTQSRRQSGLSQPVSARMER